MPKKIALIQFVSALHEASDIWESHRPLFNALDQAYELVYARPGQVFDADLTVVFIVSGGVENQFMASADKLPRPLILLADGRHNSLAASLEIMSWLGRQGENAELIHGDSGQILSRLQELILFEATRKALAEPLGIIGDPSDWLIGSTVDEPAAQKRWGTRFYRVDIAALSQGAVRVSADEAAAVAQRFADPACRQSVSQAELNSAARIYPALRDLLALHGLNAATVRCFALLESLGTTGCLALSMLSDEGKICGCEGDVASLFSMLLLYHLTGEMPFMANPSRINAGANEVILAHCTVPARATQGYGVCSHFESNRGVGIAGDMPLGPATLFKVGGSGLDEYFVSSASVLEHEAETGLCRTQVRLCLLDSSVDYFFRSPLANHHVIIKGDHADLVRRFMSHCARFPRA
jgi:L-fucose isomerase-like protein